jgi:hypothetical protein
MLKVVHYVGNRVVHYVGNRVVHYVGNRVVHYVGNRVLFGYTAGLRSNVPDRTHLALIE